ncbi:hypothetical protein HY993_02410, partial [Candidatus Micrarchaeota archaeon]|nr:hypothetical protein [Candidatus Micrarchaeota archaeon]
EKKTEASKTPALKKDEKASKPVEKKEEAKAGKKEEKKQEKKEEKKQEKKKVLLSRVHTVPLLKAYEKPQTKRGNTAIRLLREFIARHLKQPNRKLIKIDNAVNSAILARGAIKPLKKVRVLTEKLEDQSIQVSLSK